MKMRYSSIMLAGFVLLFLLSACSEAMPTQAPVPSPVPTITSTPSPEPNEAAAGSESEPVVATSTPLLADIVATRAPEPTATPGPLALAVANYTKQVGLATTQFLGVSISDWINLGISILFILGGYLIGTWVIRRLLPRLVRRTPTTYDDRLLESIGNDIRWLVTIFVLYFSTERLTFVGVWIKIVLKDIYFILGLLLILKASLKLVDLTADWYTARSMQEGRSEIGPVITMVKRVGRIVIGIIGLTVVLSHFGVDVSAFVAALGIGGLAISLAAKDTVADAIAGMILMVDRPFRVGDRIEIQGANTWGDVTDIGLRTTRIRTRDNRMVIVPNSIIGNNQVINYSYPDPRYRIETHVDVVFGTDIETVRKLFILTISQVEGVLLDKPVDALYVDMSGPAMRFRLRWWIESYVDTRRMFDRVHTAIQHALDEAGIESPHIADNVNLLIGEDTSQRLSRSFGSQRSDEGKSDDDSVIAGVGGDL